MTGYSEEYANSKVDKGSVSYHGFRQQNVKGVLHWNRNKLKTITCENDVFWYDKGGSEEKELVINSDIMNIVHPVANAEIRERNAKRKLEENDKN